MSLRQFAAVVDSAAYRERLCDVLQQRKSRETCRAKGHVHGRGVTATGNERDESNSSSR